MNRTITRRRLYIILISPKGGIMKKFVHKYGRGFCENSHFGTGIIVIHFLRQHNYEDCDNFRQEENNQNYTLLIIYIRKQLSILPIDNQLITDNELIIVYK